MRNLKFGVEIEFFGVNYQTVIDKLREAGIAVRDFKGYTHRVVNEWKVTTDSSVNSRDTGLFRGLELVSPILYEDEGLDELEKVYSVLNSVGAKVDKSCGTHVHFDIADYTVDDVVNFLNLFYRNKTLINMLVPPSRRNNKFCNNLTRQEISRINDLSSNGRIRGMNDICYILGTRYKTINLTSYVKYGTIEIRQHGGTTEFEKIEAWIVMLHQMLDFAKDTYIRAGRSVCCTENNFNKFLEHLNLNNTCVGDYLVNRFKHFKEVI